MCCTGLLLWGHASLFSVLVLQFLGEKVSYWFSGHATSPRLRITFNPPQANCLMTVHQLKTKQGFGEEGISWHRWKNRPAFGHSRFPSSLEQKQASPDSSSAVVYQFGMGKIIVATVMEEPRLFDPPLLTCWFTFWLYSGAGQLDPQGRNSCLLSREWWEREPGWAPSAKGSWDVTTVVF